MPAMENGRLWKAPLSQLPGTNYYLQEDRLRGRRLEVFLFEDPLYIHTADSTRMRCQLTAIGRLQGR